MWHGTALRRLVLVQVFLFHALNSTRREEKQTDALHGHCHGVVSLENRKKAFQEKSRRLPLFYELLDGVNRKTGGGA